ncbi:hypothetical protein GY26_17765 [Gammaproteobacteria bacterium MFB021]|nr:hypothetical protein GY26_17765 [Gammaproteobacteria bacterium MFB021]
MHYGIDVGGTKIELAVFDSQWQRLATWREATPAADGPALLARLAAMVDVADARFGTRGTLGLGLPGVVDTDGCLVAANLPGLRELPLAASLQAHFDRPIVFDNDSRCFILSEVGPGGAAAGERHAFGAILGTGAGGGAIVEGRLLGGCGGLAGEWGHLPLSAAASERYHLPRLACGCGLHGCLERYIAGPGLVELFRHFGGEAQRAETWYAAWRAGDPAAELAHRCHVDLLGEALANVTKLLAPAAIVIGGGLSTLPELVAALPAALGRHLFPGVAVPRLVASHLGAASGVRGAAMRGAGFLPDAV